MANELWDKRSGNIIDVFTSEDEALTLDRAYETEDGVVEKAQPFVDGAIRPPTTRGPRVAAANTVQMQID